MLTGSFILILVAGQIGIFLVLLDLMEEVRGLSSDRRLFARGLIDKSDLGN